MVLKKISPEQYEGVIKDFLLQRRYQILSFIFVSIVLLLLSKSVSVNLLINRRILMFIDLGLFLWIFRLPFRVMIYFMLMILGIIFVFMVLDNHNQAELWGDYLYGLLFVMVISYRRNF